MTHLGVDGKWRVPGIRWDYLDDAVLLRLFPDALNVLNRVLELLGGWPVGWGLVQAKHAVGLWRVVVGGAESSALDRREI